MAKTAHPILTPEGDRADVRIFNLSCIFKRFCCAGKNVLLSRQPLSSFIMGFLLVFHEANKQPNKNSHQKLSYLLSILAKTGATDELRPQIMPELSYHLLPL